MVSYDRTQIIDCSCFHDEASLSNVSFDDNQAFSCLVGDFRAFIVARAVLEAFVVLKVPHYLSFYTEADAVDTLFAADVKKISFSISN